MDTASPSLSSKEQSLSANPDPQHTANGAAKVSDEASNLPQARVASSGPVSESVPETIPETLPEPGMPGIVSQKDPSITTTSITTTTTNPSLISNSGSGTQDQAHMGDFEAHRPAPSGSSYAGVSEVRNSGPSLVGMDAQQEETIEENNQDMEIDTNGSSRVKIEQNGETDERGENGDNGGNLLDGSVKAEVLTPPLGTNPGPFEPSLKHQRSESPGAKNSGTASPVTKKARAEMVVVPHKKPDLVYSPLKTGLVYDVRMRYHAKIFTSYFEYIDPHPEDPRRIYRIYKILAEAGLIQDPALSGSDNIGPLMVKIPVREATAAEILQVHTKEHLQFISSTEKMTRDQLLEETERGDSIYVNNDSFLSAKLSCGGSIEACRAVVEGKVKNSMAIVRPPGHHAEPNAPGGFCLFSNVAVAAKNVLKAYPESVRRIVILDWDIHHGNGTQRAFYDDPRVLYISIHRFENGKFYPGTKYGGADKVGEGKGEGFSVNIPWSEAGVGDADYMYAFHKVVIPIMSEFDPDLVIVSAGFDAADGDIIGQCHVTPAGYGQLTHMLKAIARGKLTVILEGGYNLVSISESALGVAKVLVGEPPEATISTQPRLDTLETISEVMRIQSKYWKSMQPGISSHVFEDSYDLKGSGLTNFAEPIRAYQAQELFSKYKFVNLPVLDEKSDKSQAYFTTDLPAHLEDLVLASDNIDECGTVVISVHDSPEVWAYINPINGSIECSSSVVLEHPLTRFIEKIKTELKTENIPDTVGYIDVNIPSSNIDQGSSKNNYNATIFAQELLLWIWDNYLNYFQALKKVVFIGYGDAYQAIVHLYAKRPSQEVKELVRGTVVFASRSNLKPIVPVMDESMVDWYYQNSVIFASYMNACWAGSNGKCDGDDNGKRPRRKFGRVLKASVDSAWDITNEKFDEGIDFIVDSIADYSD